jgi:hypothetical protein
MSRHGPLRLVLEGLVVALLSVLSAAWALHLWQAQLSIPLRYTPVDDTKFYLALVKGIVEHGSYLSSSSLGAPFGQQLYDFPQGGDDLSLLLVRALALFSANPSVVVNLFFLSTFALTSFTSHLVLRALGVGAGAAGVVSVLFSLLTYHFFRGESHLLLSAYYGIPLAAYLFLKLLGHDPLFARRAPGVPHAGAPGPTTRGAWLSRRTLATVAICAVIGSDNLYYATFAVIMLGAGTLVMLVVRRWRRALVGVALAALVTACVVANLAPSLLYRAAHGGDPVLERSAAFTEASDEGFSLRIADLLLPSPVSRIAPLRKLANEYDHIIAPNYCEACYATPGTVGTVGFVWLMLCALGTLAGAGGWFAARALARNAGVGVIAALAVASVGGVASLIEVFVTPDIRAWNRISVFIAFLSLLAVALALERLVAWLGPERRGRLLARATLLAVLVFGVYDQTSESFVPPYATTARQWRSDSRFVTEIERRLPRGASVFQLPYVPFPEGYPETPVGDTVATYSTKYELLRGYLHSKALRWSYGAMKGTPADWSAQLAGQPLPYVLAAALAAGFDGLWVDPAGFEPGKAAQLRSGLRELLGEGPLVSPLGDLWFFDLRPYRSRVERSGHAALLSRLREATLHPLTVACAADGLALENPHGTARTATLSVHVLRTGESYEATLAGVPDHQGSDFPPSTTLTVSRPLTLAPGHTTVRLGRGGLPAGASSRVLYATLTETAVAGFAQAGDAATRALTPGLTGPPCTQPGG